MIKISENDSIVRDTKFGFYHLIHNNCGGALGAIQDGSWDMRYSCCLKCGKHTISQESFDKAVFIVKSLL